jgi:hypothetical protein
MSTMPTIGLEIELCLIDLEGRPYHGLAEKVINELTANGETRVVYELADWHLEINLAAQAVTGKPFTAMYAEAEEVLTEISAVAAVYSGQVVLIGILPTVTPYDIGPEFVAPVERFRVLANALGEIWKEMLCTSVQPHHYFSGIGNVVPQHNLLVATAGPIMALIANAPIMFGDVRGHDVRKNAFMEAIGERVWVNGYLHDNMQPFRDAVERGPVVTRRDLEPSLLKARLGFIPRLSSLRLACGTNWPMIGRIVFDTFHQHKRAEVRYASAGPTLADTISFLELVGGLMANPKARRITESLTEDQAHANYEEACANGPSAMMHWPNPDGQGTTLQSPKVILIELLQLAREGWQRWLDDEEIDTYLQPLVKLAGQANPVTGSVWQRQRRAAYLSKGHLPHVATRLMLLDYAVQSANGLGKPVCEWDNPNFLPASRENIHAT